MIILDSNVWIAFFHKSDSQHKKAEEILKTIDNLIMMPEYVIVEVSSVLNLRAGKKISNSFLENVLSNENIEILLSDEEFFSGVVESFIKSENKKLSLVDTSLLYLSKSYKVITFDKNLQRALKKL